MSKALTSGYQDSHFRGLADEAWRGQAICQRSRRKGYLSIRASEAPLLEGQCAVPTELIAEEGQKDKVVGM